MTTIQVQDLHPGMTLRDEGKVISVDLEATDTYLVVFRKWGGKMEMSLPSDLELETAEPSIKLFVAVYLLAIVAANLSAAAFGPMWTIVNAFLLIGLDLVIRDHLHDQWRGKPQHILALILAGGVLSYIVNADTLRIAVGSSVAFTVAMGVNALVYQVLLRKPFLVRSNVSNVPASVADSVLFPTIAFGAFLPWVILGHIVAKVLGGGVWSLIIDALRRKGYLRVATRHEG